MCLPCSKEEEGVMCLPSSKEEEGVMCLPRSKEEGGVICLPSSKEEGGSGNWVVLVLKRREGLVTRWSILSDAACNVTKQQVICKLTLSVVD